MPKYCKRFLKRFGMEGSNSPKEVRCSLDNKHTYCQGFLYHPAVDLKIKSNELVDAPGKMRVVKAR